MWYKVKKTFTIKTKTANFTVHPYERIRYDGHYLTVHPLLVDSLLKFNHGDRLKMSPLEFEKIKVNLSRCHNL